MSKENNKQVTISQAVFERIEDRLGHTEFNSVDQYVEYVLNELTLYVDDQFSVEDTEVADEEEVQERLRSLGYLRE